MGIEIWPDNSRYEGEYSNGKKNGKGILEFGDGSKYEGKCLINDNSLRWI